jgi:long-chain acyl-CoA synthetase
MYDQIVRSRRTPKHDMRSIRTCVSGAMRLPPETVTRFEAVTGGRLVEGYGLTESSPVALANPLDDHARPGTIGIPLPSTDIRIADLNEPAHDVLPGAAGELCISGPQVFGGYWNRPAEDMLQAGWLHTGDVAVMDADGFVTIVDRKRDVILASGFSIFPTEIEDVLCQHPSVGECAVVGVSHFYRGETVKAYVVLHEGKQATEADLRIFCASRLVAYKVPTEVEFRTELPHNILGKVLRRVLRAEHEAARGRRPRPTPGWAAVPPSGPARSSHVPAHGAPEPEVDGADGTSTELVDALERLVRLRDSGALSEDEFQAAKVRLLQ